MGRESELVSRQTSNIDGCNGSIVGGVFTSTMKRDDHETATSTINTTATTNTKTTLLLRSPNCMMMSTITTSLRPRSCIGIEEQSSLYQHRSTRYYRYSIWQNHSNNKRSSSTTTTTTKVKFPTMTLTSDIQKYWYNKQQNRCSLYLNKMIRKWKSWFIMISFIILYITISSLSTITMIDQHHQHHLLLWRSSNTYMSIEERSNQYYIDSSSSSSFGRRRRRQLRTQQQSFLQSVNTTITSSKQKPLHYLSFGSSLTYNTIQNDGTTTIISSSSSLYSYPYLLDSNVHVVSIPTGMNHGNNNNNNNNKYVDFAAACTQSLVDNTNTITSYNTNHNNNMNVVSSSSMKKGISSTLPPDVITIEYTSIEPLSSNHNILIQRLHRRYPNAIIVLIQLINPLLHLQLVQRKQVDHNNFTSNSIDEQEDEEEVEIIMNFQQWKQLYDQEHEQEQSQSEKISSNDNNNNNIRFNNKLINAMFKTTKEMNQNNNDNNDNYWYWTTKSTPTATTSEIDHEFDLQVLYYNHPIWNIDFKSNTVDSNSSSNEQQQQFIEQLMLFWNHFTFTDDVTAGIVMLSSYGHEQIAMGIHTTIESYRMKQQQVQLENEYDNQQTDVSDISFDNNNNNNIVQTENIGDWGSGDTCHIWYITGNYHSMEMMGGQPVNVPIMNQNIIHSESKQSTTISSLTGYLQSIFMLGRTTSSVPHKHALEFSRILSSSYFDTNTKPVYDTTGNYITVYNPFSTNRLLSLTYLTDSDGMSYPKTLIVLNDNPSVQIQPVHDLGTLNNNNNNSGNNEQQQQHIAKTSSVGYIPPGKSIVHLIPLQTTTLPFRLVGVSILAEEIYTTTNNNNNNNNDSSDSMEYAFEMDLNIPFR